MSETALSDMKALSFKFSEEYEPDIIYIKEHSPSNYDEVKPLGLTLFVAKIPLYLDETSVRKLFSEVGSVASVDLKKNSCKDDIYKDAYLLGYQCAYVVYKSRENLLKVFKLKNFRTLTDEKFIPIRGFVDQYYDSIRNRYVIEGSVISNSEKEKTEKLKGKDNVDEDGWTIVTSKGKNSTSKPKLPEKSLYKKKKKFNRDFYTFQIKESKMKNLAALMEGYEESKKKVARMKQNRLFKPL